MNFVNIVNMTLSAWVKVTLIKVCYLGTFPFYEAASYFLDLNLVLNMNNTFCAFERPLSSWDIFQLCASSWCSYHGNLLKDWMFTKKNKSHLQWPLSINILKIPLINFSWIRKRNDRLHFNFELWSCELLFNGKYVGCNYKESQVISLE